MIARTPTPLASPWLRAAVRAGAAALVPVVFATGCGGSGGASGGMAIDGHVVDTQGNDVSFAYVRVGSQSTVTDAHGQFHLDHVSAPYSAFVAESGGNGGRFFEGLGTSSPTLRVFPIYDESQQTTIAGTVTGVMYPEPAGADTYVGVRSPYNYEDSSLPNAAYTGVLVRWYGPRTVPVDLLALRIRRDANDQPIAYDGLAVAHTTVTSAVPVTGLALAMTDPAESMISGQVTLPPGAINGGVQAFVGKDGASTLLTTRTGALLSPFDIVTPDAAGATIGVVASAGTSDGVTMRFVRGLAPNATNIALDVPAPPHWVSPAVGSHGVGPGTTLSWAWSESQPMYWLRIGLSNGSNGYDVFFDVMTTANQFTIPDLSDLGLAWADGRNVVVTLFAISGAAPTADDAAGFDINHAIATVWGSEGMPEFDGSLGFSQNGFTFVSGP